METVINFAETSRGHRLLGTDLSKHQPNKENPSANTLYLARSEDNIIRPGITLGNDGKIVLDDVFTDDVFALMHDINARREASDSLINDIDALLYLAVAVADKRALNIHGYGKHQEEQNGNISEEQKKQINEKIRRAVAIGKEVLGRFGDNYDHFA